MEHLVLSCNRVLVLNQSSISNHKLCVNWSLTGRFFGQPEEIVIKMNTACASTEGQQHYNKTKQLNSSMSRLKTKKKIHIDMISWYHLLKLPGQACSQCMQTQAMV